MIDVERDERPPRYIDPDGTIVYRASSIGGCPRALLLTALGYQGRPWSEWFQEVLDEGTRMEDRIAALVQLRFEQAQGRPAPGMIVDQQREYDLKVLPGVVVRCHIDGRYPFAVTMPPHQKGHTWEFKKIRPSGWEDFKRRGVEMHTHWVWQVAAVQHATEMDSAYVKMVGGLYDPDIDAIVDLHEHVYREPVLPLGAIRRKILAIEQMIEDGKHYADVPCEPKMWPCPYVDFHDAQDEAVNLGKLRDADVIRALVAEIAECKKVEHEAKNTEQAAKLQRDEATAKLTEILTREGVVGADDETWKYTLDGREISFTYVKGSTFQTTRKPGRQLRLGKEKS